MRKLSVAELQPSDSLPCGLCSIDGTLLHKAGESLSAAHIALLRQCGIQELYEVVNDKQISQIRRAAMTEAIPLSSIVEDQKLSRPLYDADGMLLLDKDAIVTRKVKESLSNRGIHTLYIRRTAEELGIAKVGKYKDLVKQLSEKNVQNTQQELGTDEAERKTHTEVTSTTLASDNVKLLRVKPSGTPLESKLIKRDPTVTRSHQEKASSLSLHRDAISLTKKILSCAMTDVSFDSSVVGRFARNVVEMLIKDRELVLNLTNLKSLEDYLPYHSVNVCIISMNILTSLGYSERQVEEIAYGALLHDIGMVRVPKHIPEKRGALTQREWMEIRRHPIYGANILERVRGIPTSACFVAYHAHERLDGSGYVKGRRAQFIHDFAKIVAVADIYEAMTNDRPYRPAFLPFNAMEETIRLGNRNKLDKDVVKAFLRYMSLFPIGSWVEISNGMVGKVVRTHEDSFDRPCICVVYDKNKGEPVPFTYIDLKTRPDLRIVCAINRLEFEKEIMNGF